MLVIQFVALILIPLCLCRPNIDVEKQEDNPCSAARLHVHGKNHEGGNWTVKLGELEALVAHHPEGGVEDERLAGEWEASLYHNGCGEEIPGPEPPKPTSGPGGIPDDYYSVEGVGSYKLHTNFATFDRAADICQQEGADLAVINSDEEVHALKKLFNDNELLDENEILNGQAFLGLTLDDDGSFSTVDGDSLEDTGYVKWASDQPDSFMNDEECVAVLRNGKLNDVPCWLDMAFFCEISAY